MPFVVEKLEWRGYQTVKKFDDTFIRFDTTHERDRRTDRHRMTAKAARLMLASRGKKNNYNFSPQLTYKQQ